MLIMYNAPLNPTWTLTTTNGAALLSSDFSGLNDGRPGTTTAFRGNTSAANDVIITATGFSLNAPAGDPWYLLVGFLNTSFPIGSSGSPSTVNAKLNGSLNGISAGLTQKLVQYPQAIAPAPAQQPYVDAWSLFTPSQFSGSTAITQLTITLHAGAGVGASQLFNVGEIIFGLAVDVPLAKLSDPWVDPSGLNRSSGNQPWPVLRKPFRKTMAQFAPLPIQPNWLGSNALPYTDGYPSLNDLAYACSISPKLAIAPFFRQRGASANTVDTDLLQREAPMVRIVSPSTADSDAGYDYVNQAWNFEELL